eukprot:3992070-Amphidinium_carterae.2
METTIVTTKQNPTWDVNQSKLDFVKTFTTWRGKIHQYEQQTKPLDTQTKMTVLLNRLRSAAREHLLLTTDLLDSEYEKAIKMVEEYYRNVYINNEQGDLNAFKGKCYKGKGKHSKGKGKQDNSYGICSNYSHGKKRMKVQRVNTMPRQMQSTYGRLSSSGYYNKGKGKAKARAMDLHYQQSERSNKGKVKNKTVQCYLCGKDGHASPNCFWKGQTYSIDQQTPTTVVPTSDSSTNRHGNHSTIPSSSASTTTLK